MDPFYIVLFLFACCVFTTLGICIVFVLKTLFENDDSQEKQSVE